MKKYLIGGIVLLMIFAACKKNKSAPTGAAHVAIPDSSFVNGTINNEEWQTDSANVFNVSTEDSGVYNLMITANKKTDTNTSITLYITSYNGPGSYAINPPFVSATYIKGTQRYYATSGEINIASDAVYISGTYNFTADTINVTNGSFYIAR